MVLIVHPGRLRYNVGSRCTQKLAQLQWCLFFILTDTAMVVVKESTQHQEFSITKCSTMISEMLRNAETSLHTDAGRSLLTEIRRQADKIDPEHRQMILENPPKPIVRNLEAFQSSFRRIIEQNGFASGKPGSLEHCQQVERLWNLNRRAHFGWIARTEANKDRWTEIMMAIPTGKALGHALAGQKGVSDNLEPARERCAAARSIRTTLAPARIMDYTSHTSYFTNLTSKSIKYLH
jgi:hypothetical protein